MGCPLNIENIASLDCKGDKQASFFKDHVLKNDVGMLLDISNLDITIKNANVLLESWDYFFDRKPTSDSLVLLKKLTNIARYDDVYLTYERDAEYSFEDIRSDIMLVKQ